VSHVLINTPKAFEEAQVVAPLINTLLQQGAAATHWNINGFNRFTSLSHLKSEISNLKLCIPLLLSQSKFKIQNSKILHPIRQHLRRDSLKRICGLLPHFRIRILQTFFQLGDQLSRVRGDLSVSLNG